MYISLNIFISLVYYNFYEISNNVTRLHELVQPCLHSYSLRLPRLVMAVPSLHKGQSSGW